MSRVLKIVAIVAQLCPLMLAADCKSSPELCIGDQDEVSLLQVNGASSPTIAPYDPTATNAAIATMKNAMATAQATVASTQLDEEDKGILAKIAQAGASSAASKAGKAANLAAKLAKTSESKRKSVNKKARQQAAAAEVATVAVAAEAAATSANASAVAAGVTADANSYLANTAARAAQALQATKKNTLDTATNTATYGQSVGMSSSATAAATTAASAGLVARVLSDYDAYVSKNAGVAAAAATVTLSNSGKSKRYANAILAGANSKARKARNAATKASLEFAKLATRRRFIG